MPPRDSDVAITGVGLVTTLGATAGDTLKFWGDGSTAARSVLPELADTPLADSEVGVLPPLDPGERLGSRRMLKYMSSAAALGCVAAREALHGASATERFNPERIGLYAGCGIAAADVGEVRSLVEASIGTDGEFSCRLLGERGLGATNPLISFRILANMPACLVSIIEGIKGPNLLLTPWEGQTGAALLEAWKAVASGEVDCAVAGAADSAGHPASVVYLHHAGLLSSGEFPASGAGYVVLERVETAARDGKRPIARLKRVSVSGAQDRFEDPLSSRVGRTFAAAPAILLGIAAMAGWASAGICGVDGQLTKFVLEPGA